MIHRLRELLGGGLIETAGRFVEDQNLRAPEDGAEREVWEEAGFRVKARKVIGVYDANRSGPVEIFHAYKIVFLCDLIEGEARPSNETSEIAFFGADEIPAHLSGERTRPRHIEDAFAMLRDHTRPTEFD